MTYLSHQTLPTISQKGLQPPNYLLRSNMPNIGIVHIGPGAFFRAHQAWYTHKAMELGGGDWGISCISMRSPGVADALVPQNGLYVLAELDRETSYELVGSIQEVLVNSTHHHAVIDRLVNPDTYIVTLTITEKGYCLDSLGKLDIAHEDIQHDLTSEHKKSAIGLLTAALEKRKSSNLKPFSILSCDNLTDNGKKLKGAIVAYAKLTNLSLAEWLEKNLTCPCSMVDSITPATNDVLRSQVEQDVGIKDNWPIKRESFVQWVIEDSLPDPKPKWQLAGVTFTKDVRGFENAKLRLLNCPHSTLAYLGVLLNIETVFDAMQESKLVSFIQQLAHEEIIPSFQSPEELDVENYADAIMQRFRNPAIYHLLSQIAWDGSQKIPMRILPIIRDNLAKKISIDKLCISVAAWMLFIRKRFKDQVELVDPLKRQLLEIAQNCNDQADHDVNLFLQLDDVFDQNLAFDSEFKSKLSFAYERLLPLLHNSFFNWGSL